MRVRRSTLVVALIAALAALSVACGADGATPSAATGEATGGPAVSSTPADDFSGLVAVDGRNLYLECRGSGSPTVILQSGFGNSGEIWSLADANQAAVASAIAETNRVCLYDRPGSMITTTTANGTVALATAAQPARSDPAPMPRDPAVVVHELHDLLSAAGVPGPYVLVGHSLGGAFNVLYARTYPEEVSGLVIVDSPLPPVRGLLSPEQWAAISTFAGDPDAIPGYQTESYDVNALFDEIEAAPPLPEIPVVVLRRGEVNMSDTPPPDDATGANLTAINEAQRQAQADFVAGVPGAELITVPGTTQYVQTQRPDAVLDAIRQVIAAA